MANRPLPVYPRICAGPYRQKAVGVHAPVRLWMAVADMRR